MNNQADYFIGLDLGQASDFTALAVLERTTIPDAEAPGRQVNHYAVRHLERFQVGTPYTEVCACLAQLLDVHPLPDCTLMVDVTAVGRPVLDLLRRARIKVAKIQPITVAGGHKATAAEGGGWLVPKKELVSTLQVLLQSRRIQVASTLPDAPTLVQELLNFQVKVRVSPGDTFEDWREGPHDDLVLAVAIAAWQGERHRPFFKFRPIAVGGGPARLHWNW